MLLAAGACAGGYAGGATPAAEAAPHSFLVHPADQLAVPGVPAGTEVTPEGYLYTPSTELVFYAGRGVQPFRQPLRTLEGGRLPILRYGLDRDGVRYSVTVFTEAVAGHAVNFARVELRNVSRRPATGRFAVGARHSGGGDGRRVTFRFARPAAPARPGLYFQPGQPFDPGAAYGFSGGALTRNGEALYLFPPAPSGVRLRQALRPGGASARVTSSTILGLSDYDTRLAPGQATRLDFRMPVGPLPVDHPAHAAVAGASLDQYRAVARRRWRGLLAPALGLDLPEGKVVDTFYASLVNMAMARYLTGEGQWVQAVNRLQYHAFWLRDAAIMTQAFDLAGLHGIAGENLDFFLGWQQEDGLFISRPGQLDGIGQTLWAFGEHVRRSGDTELARRQLPAVIRAMDWLSAARRADPLGLLPPGNPRDNERVAGHLAGDNYWAAAGVEGAVVLARAVGEDELAARWRGELAELRRALHARARRAAARTGGWIPPSLDSRGGEDWGNMWLSYPSVVYAPGDPLVTATLRHLRRRSREGLATYAGSLHHYTGFRRFQTELVRGQQRDVVDALYASLAHTTATHGGFEYNVRPYGDRSAGNNLTPHGVFAAEYVALLRNMLVREQGNDLVLLSAVPSAWLRPGRRVRVRAAPTPGGRVSFDLRGTPGGAVLSWSAPAGTRLRWPVPAAARDVRARGLTRDRRTVFLPASSGTLRVGWRLGDDRTSYRRAVDRLLASYRSR